MRKYVNVPPIFIIENCTSRINQKKYGKSGKILVHPKENNFWKEFFVFLHAFIKDESYLELSTHDDLHYLLFYFVFFVFLIKFYWRNVNESWRGGPNIPLRTPLLHFSFSIRCFFFNSNEIKTV